MAKCSCIIDKKDILEDIKNEMIDIDTIIDLSDFFKVMGDSTRLQILLALAHDELCVSSLVNALNISQSAISHQLKALRTNKLVKQRRQGREIFYSLDDDHIKTILNMSYAHILEK